ncbi:MAG: hypothetical protein ACYTEN_08980 [Planctomycetota bacterium]|jgi:hypothetical protein
MKETQKPSFLIVTANLGVMFFTLIGLGLSGSCNSIGLRLIMISGQSLLIVLAVFQCVLYLKNYIDYQLNEMELNKSVKSA